MPDKNLGNLLKLYNPWWDDHSSRWRENLPDYQRPVVSEVLSDIKELPQIISITGPRRVGKSTVLKQVIRYLLDKLDIDPSNILYFSFDDPEVYGSEDLQRVIFDNIRSKADTAESNQYPIYP